MAVINVEIVHVWSLRDADDAALTGLSGNMSATLTRYPTKTTSESATETVSIAEIGSTGDYTLSYTPTKAYLYTCIVLESSLALEFVFEDNVLGAATSAVATDAYCSEADVVGVVQITPDYTSGTTPTETEVLQFMKQRAAQVYAWMAEKAGTSAPGPVSFTTSIDTSTDIGSVLESVCRQANCVGAGADALEASGATSTPGRTERLNELFADFFATKDTIQALVEVYIGTGKYVSNHFTEGSITSASIQSRVEDRFTFDGETQW